MPFMPSIPDDGTAADIFAAFDRIYAPFVEFCEEVFRGEGPLTPKERELIFAYVSGQNACAYCFGGHSATAIAFGFDEDVFGKLDADIATAPIDSKLKALLTYVRKLNRTPERMVQADADAVYAAGWDEEALHSAIALCCLANYMNRLVEGCGIKARPEAFEARGEMAKERGYREPFYAKREARLRGSSVAPT